MELKKYLNSLIIGVIGSILLIISEFFSWFSDDSLFEIYVIYSSNVLEDAFLFLFPLMSGIICLVADVLVIYRSDFKIKSVIISFVGLGFLLIFFIDYITRVIGYISNAGVGFYIGVAGFILIFSNILNILLTREKHTGGT